MILPFCTLIFKSREFLSYAKDNPFSGVFMRFCAPKYSFFNSSKPAISCKKRHLKLQTLYKISRIFLVPNIVILIFIVAKWFIWLQQTFFFSVGLSFLLAKEIVPLRRPFFPFFLSLELWMLSEDKKETIE